MTVARARLRTMLWGGGVLVGVFIVAAGRGLAHKPVTSKHTYNEHVFPIFRDRCASCHVAGGIAPMSLTTYDDAYPWAESIHTELLAGHMPPWSAQEGYGHFKKMRSLSAAEFDAIIDWATGGNPKGDLSVKLPAVELKNEWPLGKPDVELPMPAPFDLAANKMDDTTEVTIPSGTTSDRWLRAVDLLPGTPSIVRSAVIYTKASSNAPEEVLALWNPGGDTVEAPRGTAFRLPAGAAIGLRIRYKKTYEYEGKAMTDRSTVGLYFANGPAEAVRSLALTPAAITASGAAPSPSTTAIDDDVEVVAIRDEIPTEALDVRVQATRPDGSHVPLIHLITRPTWHRRYWLEQPLVLPRGSRVEISAAAKAIDDGLLGGALPPAGGGSTEAVPAGATATVSLDVVSPRGGPRHTSGR